MQKIKLAWKCKTKNPKLKSPKPLTPKSVVANPKIQIPNFQLQNPTSNWLGFGRSSFVLRALPGGQTLLMCRDGTYWYFPSYAYWLSAFQSKPNAQKASNIMQFWKFVGHQLTAQNQYDLVHWLFFAMPYHHDHHIIMIIISVWSS